MQDSKPQTIIWQQMSVLPKVTYGPLSESHDIFFAEIEKPIKKMYMKYQGTLNSQSNLEK